MIAAFLKLVAKKQAERRDVAASLGQGDASARAGGRPVRPAQSTRVGVQLNVRAPMEVKAAVITERLRGKSSAMPWM